MIRAPRMMPLTRPMMLPTPSTILVTKPSAIIGADSLDRCPGVVQRCWVDSRHVELLGGVGERLVGRPH